MRSLSCLIRPVRRLALLVASCAVLLVSVAAASSVPATARPDYSAWSALLQKYVVVVSSKGEPYDTRFDYEQLYVDEGIFGRGVSSRLSAIRHAMLAVPPDQMSEKDRTAWKLNLYEFLVLEQATLHLIVPNRKYLRFDSVDEMNFSVGGFFDSPVVNLGGRDYSIAEYERRVLYADTTTELSESRKCSGDPRWALALSRGIRGGPPVLPWAFSGDSLDAQLDRAARIALALPRFVKVDVAAKAIALSEYFAASRADYGGDLSGVRLVLAKLGPPAARSVAKDANGVIQPTTMPVDRKLDQYPRPKQAAPVAEKSKS